MEYLLWLVLYLFLYVSGSAWVSRIIQEMLDHKDELSVPSHKQTPFIEMTIPGSPQTNLERFMQMPKERFFSTHLLPNFYEKEMLENRPKMIILMRNVKDCLVSYYHFYRATGALGKFEGSFTDFWEQLVLTEHLIYGDGVKYLEAWWKYKNEDNFLFLKYEDLKRDPTKYYRKLAEHIGVDVPDDKLASIIERTSFKTMSSDPLTNRENAPKAQFDNTISKYFRKGIVGDWKGTFSDEQSAYIDKQMEKLNEDGLHFDEA